MEDKGSEFVEEGRKVVWENGGWIREKGLRRGTKDLR